MPNTSKSIKKVERILKKQQFFCFTQANISKTKFFSPELTNVVGTKKTVCIVTFFDKSKDIPDIEQKTLTEKSCFRAQ